MPVLVQFLGNHPWRDVGIKKSIPDDLTNHLIGSTVVPVGASFLAFESPRALCPKPVQDLVVALSRVVILLCRFERAKAFTFALKEHSKFEGDFIISSHGERSFWARQRRYPFMEFDHILPPP